MIVQISICGHIFYEQKIADEVQFQRRCVMKPSYVIVWWIGPTDKIYPQPENVNCSLKGHTGKSSSLQGATEAAQNIP